jgi:hypothetical protein
VKKCISIAWSWRVSIHKETKHIREFVVFLMVTAESSNEFHLTVGKPQFLTEISGG